MSFSFLEWISALKITKRQLTCYSAWCSHLCKSCTKYTTEEVLSLYFYCVMCVCVSRADDALLCFSSVLCRRILHPRSQVTCQVQSFSLIKTPTPVRNRTNYSNDLLILWFLVFPLFRFVQWWNRQLSSSPASHSQAVWAGESLYFQMIMELDVSIMSSGMINDTVVEPDNVLYRATLWINVLLQDVVGFDEEVSVGSDHRYIQKYIDNIKKSHTAYVFKILCRKGEHLQLRIWMENTQNPPDG